ncbi:integrase core domain-containing protein [Bradyrhizobium guangdongense]|uniref:integrase core domain-containing protein n=1 Tax=Bradyrhizobium guangdongense TaxID=1325090 RepID=UPI001319C995|nr:integrase core domain-containing protein [Bradyrhizobium guangdongense]
MTMSSTFDSLDHIANEVFEQLFYYNNHRPHQALAGQTPQAGSAISRAAKLVDGHDVELSQRDRPVARFEAQFAPACQATTTEPVNSCPLQRSATESLNR